ncbi:MAG: hypothetical protein IIA05_11675 [Proteobacteria bacterium]|nr:hypothetical protein [Pseudomonadota bacterium]
MKIKILETPEYKKGSARAKWFTAIKRYNGKDVDDFVAATAKRPPVLTKSGEPEPPAGWLRYFVREEVIELT